MVSIVTQILAVKNDCRQWRNQEFKLGGAQMFGTRPPALALSPSLSSFLH